MTGRESSYRARAGHVRALARQTKDEWGPQILLDIARELEAKGAAAPGAADAADEAAPGPQPIPPMPG